MTLPKIDITNRNVIAVTRTAIAYVWVYLMGLALDLEFVANTPWIGDLLSDLGTYVTGDAFVIVAGTVLYAAIFAASERWSWIGWFLIFKNKTPTY